MRSFLILSLIIVPALSAFLPSDLPRPFLLRRGGSCPQFLEFLVSTPSAPQFDQVLILDSACTSGSLTLDASEDVLASYLSGFQEIGSTITIFVEDALVCPSITFQPGALFTFVKASADVEIDFSRAFGRNGTDIAADGTYVFPAGGDTLILGDKCLYTRLTEEEIDRQRGECFPGSAVVTIKQGNRRIADVQTGETVWDGVGWTKVIGWTHRDASYKGKFVRIATKRFVVTASSGHYLYVNNALVQAGDVEIGMRVQGEAVRAVSIVHRKGLYNPQTASGDIVVDGVRCSTYTNAVEPIVAHALMAPVRIAAAAGLDLLNALGVC